MIKRRKLFSSTPSRRKLFSSDNNLVNSNISPKSMTVICMDCGYMMDTTATTTSSLYCPKCGGKRFSVVKGMTNVDEIKDKSSKRRSLFDKFNERQEQEEFLTPSDKLEEKLKTYSGKIISDKEINKIFSDTGYNKEDLVEKGFAQVVEDNNVKIYDSAYLQSKLFSKLIVSVTKVLDLDPIDKPKSDIIDMLSERGCMDSKSITLIKKAHSIPIIREGEFSETDEWIKDSGIQNDLHLEFNGNQMELDKFKEILSERYDDAPEDIIDKLSENNIIKIQGNIVEIL